MTLCSLPTPRLRRGYADIGRDLHDPSVTPYRVPLHLHVECQLVATLVQQLTASGVTNLSTLSAFADAEPFPLRWGEVIPLALIQRSLDLNRTSVLLLSQPSRRRTDSVSMIPELRALGGALFKTLDAWALRVAVVISADLAHTHLASGPYGFSPAAAPFDAACGRWAQTLDSHWLTAEAVQYVDRALSCGFTGLVMLDGLLQAAVAERPPAKRRPQNHPVRDPSNPGPRWVPALLAIAHPTYYGMMVAVARPEPSVFL